MVFPADSYVFAVNTYRGHGGAAPQRLDALLRTRGQKLSLAGGVPMPGNSFINAPEKDAAYLQQQEENIKTLGTYRPMVKLHPDVHVELAVKIIEQG